MITDVRNEEGRIEHLIDTTIEAHQPMDDIYGLTREQAERIVRTVLRQVQDDPTIVQTVLGTPQGKYDYTGDTLIVGA